MCSVPSEVGDHLSMWLSAHQTHELNRCREHSSSLLDGKKCTSEWHVMVTVVTKTWFKPEFKTGF